MTWVRDYCACWWNLCIVSVCAVASIETFVLLYVCYMLYVCWWYTVQLRGQRVEWRKVAGIVWDSNTQLTGHCMFFSPPLYWTGIGTLLVVTELHYCLQPVIFILKVVFVSKNIQWVIFFREITVVDTVSVRSTALLYTHCDVIMKVNFGYH